MGGNQSQPNATAIIGTGKGGPLDTSAGTIASRGISFTYDHAAEPALRDITLTVPAGECIVLCGASGCGKTSYTRVANGLIPSFFHGAFAGNQTTCGLDVETVPIDRLTPLVGSVFQNPKTQYFNANVTDELAFPAENIGLPAEDINRRITAVAERFGIGHLLHRSIFHLSGGQKQRIAVAAATMLGPRVVVLDEPTSNLDANAIADMRAMIEQMKDEGLTIVIAEHRLAWLNGVADRYVVFDGGHIVQDYEADEFLSLSPGCVAAMGLRALDLQPYRRRIAALASSPAADECTSVLLGTHNLTIGYKGKDGFTRAIPDLRFRAGEITGLMGNNGCGKTTLVRTLTGLIKPVSGRIELNGVPAKPRDLTRAGFLVMQDVNYQLFSDSVREELLIGLDETDAGITAQANQVMADLDLATFVERHPMSLSGGQKQRVAIGSALMCGKDLIILDEPTSGLDRYHMEQVGELLRQLASQGKAILVVTHDEELAAGWCDRIVNLGADDSGNNGSHGRRHPADTEAAEQAVLANPKMAPMAARGIRTFWSMACSTTSPENIIHIGYWRVNEPAAESGSTDDAALAIEWFAEDDTSLDTYEYTIDHVIEHGLEGSPTFVFHTTDPAAEDSPFRWLLAINPLPSRKAFAEGGLLSHLHFQYANDLHTLVATDEATGTETLRNPRWYATMCANEGTVEDRCAIIRALHHLQ